MQLVLEIPDGLGEQLRPTIPLLERSALEALAAKAYSLGALSVEQVRLLLGLDSFWEAQTVLGRHGEWPGTTVEEFRSDTATLKEFLSRP